MSKKYGSFNVEIDYYSEYGKKNTKTHTVSPLSQQELVNEWRLVLPKKKIKKVQRENDSGRDINVRKTNERFFKINLAQLPPHLFSKLKNIYRGEDFLHYTARDNCYIYIVNPTPVDNEIRILFKFCQLYNNSFQKLTDEEKEDVKNCISLINEYEIKGWVVMKANRLFSNI